MSPEQVSLPTPTEHRRRALFDALYVEWLTTRATYVSGKYEPSEEAALSDRECELARLIVTTPAVQSWMIMRKLEVLEYVLATSGGIGWTDNREVTMVGAIKADLLRFEPSDTR